jgi:uncharacterized protein with FMN-binding domain
MKKLLLSVAVIAVSSAYVVYENQAAPPPSGGAAAAITPATPAAPAVPPRPAHPAVAALGGGRAASALVVSPAAATSTPQLVTKSPAAPTPARLAERDPMPPPLIPAGNPTTPRTEPDAAPAPAATAEPAPVVPLPRPRPADAPAAAVAQASVRVAQAPGGYRDGTFQGVSANAYYGRVQVDAVVSGGQLVKVEIVDFPNDRRTSRRINSRALPSLEQEAIQAQSASIDAVSGATLTSEAFVRSLDSALSRARGRGNA